MHCIRMGEHTYLGVIMPISQILTKHHQTAVMMAYFAHKAFDIGGTATCNIRTGSKIQSRREVQTFAQGLTVVKLIHGIDPVPATKPVQAVLLDTQKLVLGADFEATTWNIALEPCHQMGQPAPEAVQPDIAGQTSMQCYPVGAEID